MLRALFCLTAVWSAPIAIGQVSPLFHVQRYGPEHGLSNRHVTALLQDDVGYIWVGSVSGLDRFDGHTFRTWTVLDGLSGGRVDALRSDAQGQIWVFSSEATDDITSIDLLDPMTGALRPLSIAAPAFPVPLQQVVRVAPRRNDGAVVLGTRSPAGCIIYHHTSAIRHIPLDGERFEPLGSDNKGRVFGHLVGSTGAQSIVLVDTLGHITPVRTLEPGTIVRPLTTGRTGPGALYVSAAPNGTTHYFDTYSELYVTYGERLERSAAATYDPVFRPLNITPFMRRPMRMEGSMIIGRNNETLFDLDKHYAEVTGRVKDCILDRNDQPWVGTEFGLFRIELRGEAFQRLLYQDHLPVGTGTVVRGMAWHKDRLYVSTEWDGAYTLDPSAPNAIHRYEAEPQFLFAGHVSPKGTWWRGGVNTLVRQDSSGKNSRYTTPDHIWCVLDNDQGRVLLGGFKGLYWLDPSTGSVVQVSHPKHPELDRAHVLQIHAEGPRSMRIATNKGLYRLDQDGNVLERWWTGATHSRRIPYDDLHHCFEDSDGDFWLATRGAGLVRFDPASGAAEVFSTRNGYPNNMVYATYQDSDGQLWSPTDGGLVRFHKESRQSALFTTADGLAHDEFNRLAHAQAPDGRLYFGGLNGITGFDPKDLKATRTASEDPFVLTGLWSHGAAPEATEDLSHALHGSPHVSLGTQGRSLQVSFALLTFHDTQRILYAWRIAGVADHWNYQHEATLRLDRLPPGDHMLELRARDAFGRWHDHVLRLPISVEAHWYASRWIWTSIGAALALITMLLMRLYWTRSQRSAHAVILRP